MPVALVLLSDPERFRRRTLADGRPEPYRPLFERFVAGGGEGACVVLVDVAGRGADALLSQQRPVLLDWCALLARFGRPGHDVRRWSRAAFVSGWRSSSSLAELIPVAGGEARRELDTYEVRACQSGAAQSCLGLLGMGREREPWFGTREIARDFLAWQLATEEPERFGRFWRADGSIADALSAAYGRPAGETIARWARQRLGASTRRPQSAPGVLLAGAVWVSVAMVAAFVAMHRRQVS